MTLKLTGDFALWAAVFAVLLGGAAWFLYRRETLRLRRAAPQLLPVIRALVVVMIMLMFTGPVLHRRETIGQVCRVILGVDCSESMSARDGAMEPGRKLMLLSALGLFPGDEQDLSLARTAEGLAELSAAASASSMSQDLGELRRSVESVKELASVVEKALEDGGGPALTVQSPVMGQISFAVWTGVTGSTMEDLRRAPGFPDKPSSVSLISSFEIPANKADNYGSRLQGYLYPPQTGKYVFWISSDDASELLLSSNSEIARKRKIAGVSDWTMSGEWEKYPSQKSEPVELKAGTRYYIEALHKEGIGGDHLAVGWQLPSGVMERPIPGSRLSSVESAGDTRTILDIFRSEVAQAVEKLGKEASGDIKQLQAGLSAIGASASSLQGVVSDAFDAQAAEVINKGGKEFADALGRLDSMNRWQRAQALLLSADRGLARLLCQNHGVELVAVSGNSGKEAQVLWKGMAGRLDESGEAPSKLESTPSGRLTNLSDPVLSLAMEAGEGGAEDHAKQESEDRTKKKPEDQTGQKTVVVLLSDGRHNDGTPPAQVARILGNRGVPVYAVGMGTVKPPLDLSVRGVQAPNIIFHKDRVKGKVLLHDNMPSGLPFVLRLECEGQPMFQKDLQTQNSGEREIEFDFPVDKLVADRLGKKEAGVEYGSVPLWMSASVPGLEGDTEERNNRRVFPVQAAMSRRSILLLDGRPRWEFRYLRNLFKRDEHWVVNPLLADSDSPDGGWKRGGEIGTYPVDRETLFSYDLVVLGEVPPGVLKQTELECLRDFIIQRGGALLLLDGRRGFLREITKGPLSAAVPVEYGNASLSGMPEGIRLTEAGKRLPPLQLGASPELSASLWKSFLPPKWTTAVSLLPGAETLLEAQYGNSFMPVLSFRRFGAGRVLHSGMDESWRMRYKVAEKYHEVFWKQLVNWLIEPPYQVSDQLVSLDAGAMSYAPGDDVEIRARLKDASGEMLFSGQAEARISRDGRNVASVQLIADENMGGVFRGVARGLPEGRYEVRVAPPGVQPEKVKARVEFVVQPAQGVEMADTRLDPEMMRQIAADSGGRYLAEENAGRLVEILKPLSDGKVVDIEIVLWQSWWWLALILALLAIEWVLRKRFGLI